ncbi:unnamed protein product [Rhizophagus irregularis]|nr:unnamed protein product [Rhizophagus irregularis]
MDGNRSLHTGQQLFMKLLILVRKLCRSFLSVSGSRDSSESSCVGSSCLLSCSSIFDKASLSFLFICLFSRCSTVSSALFFHFRNVSRSGRESI